MNSHSTEGGSTPAGRSARPAAFALGLAGLAALAASGVGRGAASAAVAATDRAGAWGPVAFAGVYAVATLAFVPGSVLTLTAGALFGPWVGALASTAGATAGAAGAFLVARFLARDAVARAAARRPGWAALDEAVARGGWKVVALLRLSPLVPFNVQNYLYGLTRVGFLPCVLTSAAAMLPGAFVYASLGAAGRVGLEASGAVGPAGGLTPRGPAGWALPAVGVLATLALTAYLGRTARRVLAEAGGEGEGVTGRR